METLEIFLHPHPSCYETVTLAKILTSYGNVTTDRHINHINTNITFHFSLDWGHQLHFQTHYKVIGIQQITDYLMQNYQLFTTV